MRKNKFCSEFGQNKIFGSGLLSIDWFSKINFSNNRGDKIRQGFSYTKVEFHHPNDVEDLDLIIETFEKETYEEDKNTNENCNIFGENKKFDKIIVMDNVSGLADKSNGFANFLTVSRKFGYICLYIFRIIYPAKSIWEMILSQTKIFNTFPFTIQLGNILKILANSCDRETIHYIPARDFWISTQYMSLSNKSKYSCLTIDCRK